MSALQKINWTVGSVGASVNASIKIGDGEIQNFAFAN